MNADSSSEGENEEEEATATANEVTTYQAPVDRPLCLTNPTPPSATLPSDLQNASAHVKPLEVPQGSRSLDIPRASPSDGASAAHGADTTLTLQSQLAAFGLPAPPAQGASATAKAATSSQV